MCAENVEQDLNCLLISVTLRLLLLPSTTTTTRALTAFYKQLNVHFKLMCWQKKYFIRQMAKHIINKEKSVLNSSIIKMGKLKHA